MHEFQMGSTGSPVTLDSLSSSHYARHRFSRRAFIGGAAAATGATLGSGLLSPAAALAWHTQPAPKPTTAVATFNGIDFHLTFFGPGMDPSSITDFKGFVGVADVQGTGTARNPDGSVETLLFDTDMRFMKGIYVGQDGGVHRGTFGFVWLDLYQGQFDLENFTTQVHDFNPGIHPYPGGLFWTDPLQGDAVRADLREGKARMTAGHLRIRDFFNTPNALFHFQQPVSVGATVSFDVRWTGPATSPSSVTSPPGSSGRLFMSPATMTWSAKNAEGFRFRSNPSGTTSVFGQLGHVRNGVFSHWRNGN